MAPFSTFFTSLAFAIGAPRQNRIKHNECMLDTTLCTRYQDRVSHYRIRKRHSPCFILPLAAQSESDVLDNSLPSHDDTTTTSDCSLSHLANLLGATPTNLLTLESNDEGVRGVYVNQSVSQDDILLRIPIDSCLRDDCPPEWFLETHSEDDCPAMHPSAWASRLAASLVHQQLFSPNEGMKLWLQLLPNAKLLRASLPIHWDEDLVTSARCTALELAIDSAYFSRANAVTDLTMALPPNVTNLKELCDNALDIIQTRSCRVETADGRRIRLLVPIFDFINHNSTPNAIFALEKDHFVLRALRDLNRSEQVSIHYGEATRPQWKCLMSYGFVPEYNEADKEANMAEVYVQGKRYEVGPSSIPLELVETMEALHFSERGVLFDDTSDEKAAETMLIPEVALRLANRLSQVAFQLLLGPVNPDEELATLYQDSIDQDDKQEDFHQSPEEMISARLAASLRWAQHRTLLSCGKGLEDLARGQCTAKMRGEV